jgi:hypothetical protein
VRRKIWRNHLSAVPDDEIEMEIEEALNSIGSTKMNGREISNSINTARTLAKSEGSKLKLEYLETIIQVWTEFEESLAAAQKLESTAPSV